MKIWWINPPRTAERLASAPLDLDRQHRLIRRAARMMAEAGYGEAHYRTINKDGSVEFWLDDKIPVVPTKGSIHIRGDHDEQED